MKIYMSYRRKDAGAHAGRLADRLIAHFGKDSVLSDALALHGDLRDAIEREVRRADVVLVLMGRSWLHARNDDGERCLDSPSDFVRIEIECALRRDEVIIPVLVDEARMPSAEQMPDSLAAIIRRQGVSLGTDPDYHEDVDRLIGSIERLAARSHPTTASASRPAPGPATSVFVSHSAMDRTWVEREIVDPLHRSSIRPWYSKAAISSASQWEREILRGLESSEWFLLVASPRAARSEWVKDELNWAMHNRPTRIVPVVMEPCNLWDFHIRLPRIQHIDFTDLVDDARTALIQRFSGEA